MILAGMFLYAVLTTTSMFRMSAAQSKSRVHHYHVKFQAKKLEAILAKGLAKGVVSIRIETSGNISIKSSRITLKKEKD